MARPSRFQGVLDAARAAPPEPAGAEEAADPGGRGEAAAEPARRGRPPVGKKSNPAYRQVTAYVRRDLYRDVRIALLRDPAQPDFSDLLEGLLDRWRREQPGGEPGG